MCDMCEYFVCFYFICLFLSSLLLLFCSVLLSVPVQVIVWKDLRPKCAIITHSQMGTLSCVLLLCYEGFVLKKDQKKENAEEEISLEDLIEREVLLTCQLLSVCVCVCVWSAYYELLIFNCPLLLCDVFSHYLVKISPLSSSRQHFHIDDCLEDNREDY